jgi:hypothetical protein
MLTLSHWESQDFRGFPGNLLNGLLPHSFLAPSRREDVKVLKLVVSCAREASSPRRRSELGACWLSQRHPMRARNPRSRTFASYRFAGSLYGHRADHAVISGHLRTAILRFIWRSASDVISSIVAHPAFLVPRIDAAPSSIVVV